MQLLLLVLLMSLLVLGLVVLLLLLLVLVLVLVLMLVLVLVLRQLVPWGAQLQLLYVLEHLVSLVLLESHTQVARDTGSQAAAAAAATAAAKGTHGNQRQPRLALLLLLLLLVVAGAQLLREGTAAGRAGRGQGHRGPAAQDDWAEDK